MVGFWEPWLAADVSLPSARRSFKASTLDGKKGKTILLAAERQNDGVVKISEKSVVQFL